MQATTECGRDRIVMHLSDLVGAIQHDIGDAMEADPDDLIDPQLMLRINGIVTVVDEIQINQHEIILSPRGS